MIDQIRLLEEEIERTHRLATLGIVAGSIAHEFNNLLTPVLSYAQLALAAPEDRHLCMKALNKVVDGTERAARVASAMLGFVRQEDESEDADVRLAADAALSCLGRDHGRQVIEFVNSVSPGTHVAIRPIALQQVIFNLVLNAIEAIGDRPGIISIRDGHGSTWNRSSQTCLEVSDSGPGIPPELVGRIFEPFVSKRHRQGKVGTGLGLAICKRLVEEAGGSIVVVTNVGQGACFHIVLNKV